MKSVITLAFVAAILSSPSFAWDGYDYTTGSYIEIENGNLVRSGREIEYYDYGGDGYKYADVESIERYGSSVELEIYDRDTGEYRTFEMEN